MRKGEKKEKIRAVLRERGMLPVAEIRRTLRASGCAVSIPLIYAVRREMGGRLRPKTIDRDQELQAARDFVIAVGSLAKAKALLEFISDLKREIPE